MSFFDVKAAEGRFEGVTRAYTEQDVQRLRGSVHVQNTLAQLGADKLWELLQSEPYVHALGALSGNQASGLGARRRRLAAAHLRGTVARGRWRGGVGWSPRWVGCQKVPPPLPPPPTPTPLPANYVPSSPP
jgi:hypothetical protein